MMMKEAFMHYLQHEHIFPGEAPELLSYREISYNEIALPAQAPPPELQLDDLLNQAKASGTLGTYIRQLALSRDMLTYRAARFESGQISRDYWSRLLNDEVNASKEKLLRVAVLLQLSCEEAEEMLEKAGYSLSPTILRDVIVGYCLQRRIYDFAEIEETLADREVQSLFNDRKGA
ncbi:hypothetical protein FE782_01825 [Paenibacillus antri]|uniref:Uncharacterized protein n=2 Tax=Paenibacillus antri TaxID=2582848 RepID=A0A5R9GKP9_9BACL|nr:hypothetical protein FE782_01825 [Paenibacillus antri]